MNQQHYPPYQGYPPPMAPSQNRTFLWIAFFLFCFHFVIGALSIIPVIGILFLFVALALDIVIGILLLIACLS